MWNVKIDLTVRVPFSFAVVKMKKKKEQKRNKDINLDSGDSHFGRI